jgi:enamine deaminase RidA (YjgF/YER057c/UK114 family)
MALLKCRKRNGTPCRQPSGGKMELVTHKKLKGGRLMPWGKGTVVTGARGFVLLGGNTATTDDYEPFKKGGGAVGDAAAQWRNLLTNIKSDLEELGTSLDHLIKLTFFMKGPFPAGGVVSSPNFRQDVMDEFFAQHCPKHCKQSSALGGHRGCCACASRPRHRDSSGRGTDRLASSHVLPQCVSSPHEAAHEPAPCVESPTHGSRPAPLRRLVEGAALSGKYRAPK